MATIGSINIAFGADPGGLKRGVDESIDSLGKLRESIAETSQELAKFSASVTAQANVAAAALNKMDVEKQIRIDADFSAVEDAASKVDDLATSIESPVVTLKADSSQVAAGVDRSRAFLDQFASVASEAFQRTGDEAVAGARRFDTLRTSAQAVAASVTGTYAVIQGAARATASAINGIGDAASAVGRAGQEGFKGLESAADRTVVAVGRTYDAVSQIREAGDGVKAALLGGVAGAKTFAATVGGVDRVVAAFGGSAAATSQVLGSLGSVLASATASIAAYSAVVAAARVATAGMSEESRIYVERAAQVVGAYAGVRAGLAAGSASYRVIAAAIFNSNSATEASQKLFSILGNSLAQASGKAQAFAGSLSSVATVYSLVKAAANEKQTASGFTSAVAQSAGVAVAFGAVAGAAKNLATGQSILAGATTGATAAMGGLLASFPATAALAATAAVATGRFSDKLEELAGKAESIEQMADRFGSSAEQIEKVKTAASNANVSMMALIRSQQNFYSNLSKVRSGQFDSQNVREAKIAFDELGIPVEKLKSLKPEEAFKLVSKSLFDVKNAADRTRIAVDLFGARGAFALPALKEIGELEEDFNRLGGAIRKVDFGNILEMEKSFDRLKNANSALGRTLIVPFISLQGAFNNFSAELRGGLVAALAPLMTMLNDITKPIAVIIEAFGRMINVALRLIGIFTGVAAFFQVFASVAKIFEGIGQGFRAALAPLEGLIEALTSGSQEAGIFSSIVSAVSVVLNAVGVAIGFVIGAAANVVVALAAGGAAWVVYTAAVALASATSITAAISFATAWAAALGPLVAVVAILAAVGGAIMVVVEVVKAAFSGFIALGRAIGIVGKQREQIDASSASAKDLAAAAREAQDAASWFSDGEDESTIASSVDRARDSFNNLVTESLKYGKAGSDTIVSVQKRYADLEQSLADGKISTAEFTEKTTTLFASAAKGMQDYEKSAAVALNKNLELYKRLDDAAKQAGKSIRDLSSERQVDDKILPASDEVKRRASELQTQYTAALEAIKKKQQSGGFQEELNQKKKTLDEDLSSGRISQDQYVLMKMELDSTSAQEQASRAAEDVQRKFDQKTAKLKADISFADEIRKRLDESFMNPVQKFQKELKKIRDNPELSESEKISAEGMVKRELRENMLGEDAQSSLSKRSLELGDARDAGVISDAEFGVQMKKAMDDFAQAVGVTKTPFEEFSSRLSDIADQFGFAGQPLDEVRRKLSGNAEQLAIFDRAVQEARDGLLSSLGVDKSPQKAFEEQAKKITEAANAADPTQRITESEAGQAMNAATRARDAALGLDENASAKFDEQLTKINEAFANEPGKLAAATASAMDEFASSVGVTKTPFEEFSSRLGSLATKFGFAGEPLDEVRRKLADSPEKLKLFDRAVMESRDNLLKSLGVEKSPQKAFEEQMAKIDEAVNATDPSKRITAAEAEQARNAATRSRDAALGLDENVSAKFDEQLAKINEAFANEPGKLAAATANAMDDLASAIGVTKTPFEEFSSRMDSIATKFGFAGESLDEVRRKLADTPEKLKLFDRAVEEARDNLLKSLGVEKSPQKVFEDQMKKIDEAVNATDPSKKITAAEADQARESARRTRDSALGAGENLGSQFASRRARIDEAYGNDPARRGIAMNRLAMDRRQAAGLDATPTQALKAGVDKIKDAFNVTGLSMEQIRSKLSPEDFAEYQEALKKNTEAVKASLGVEKTGAEKFAEAREKLTKAVKDGVISDEERNRALKKQKDDLLSSLGISKTPAEEWARSIEKLNENASELNPEEMAKGMAEARDRVLSALSIDKSPAESYAEQMKKLTEANNKHAISEEEFAKGAQKAKDSLLQSLGVPLDPVAQLGQRLKDLNAAFDAGQIDKDQFRRGQEEAKRSFLPGSEAESPVKQFERDMKALRDAQQQGMISGDEFASRRLNLQSQLEESLKPALDALKPDRRGIEGADSRSKAGVDTFFRILRGNDNPSLKAQLETAKNTRLLAEASKTPEAAPLVARI